MEQIIKWIEDVKLVNPWILWGGIIMAILIFISMYFDDHLDDSFKD